MDPFPYHYQRRRDAPPPSSFAPPPPPSFAPPQFDAPTPVDFAAPAFIASALESPAPRDIDDNTRLLLLEMQKMEARLSTRMDSRLQTTILILEEGLRISPTILCSAWWCSLPSLRCGSSAGMEAAGIQAARWMLGKALGPLSSGALEAWAASTELGPNIRALRMELLYAQGILNNARGRGRDQEIQNPALTELLQELRDLGYRADDVLDELEYFRIQDELDGTYHAADEHGGGCLRNCSLNARHTATAIAKKLVGFSKCCSSSASHNEGDDDDTGRGVSLCGAWPCLGLQTPPDHDDDQEEGEASQGVRCGAVCWPCGRASATTPPTSQLGDHEVGHGCISSLTSSARGTIHAVGKLLPCHHSSSCVRCHENSNIASSERRRFLCCTWPNKAQQRENAVQAPKLKFNRVEMSQTMKEIVQQLKPVCAKVSTILNLELLDSNHRVAQWIATSLDGRLSNKQWHIPLRKNAMSWPITTSESEFYGREAQMVKTVDHHIDLEGLDHEAFTQLFFACAFGDNKTKNDHSEFLETGYMIIEKLKGSPLAAKTVGRLLRHNLDLDHWTRVLESREWESQTGDHDIMPALKLSFDYLPFHLQQCFAYCALFPEDYRFCREELIHFWIGLDILYSSHNENISIEDIGLRNLKDLVNHGFLKMEEDVGDTCYVIHDLLHELALKVSAHECLSINSSNVSSTQIPLSIRHLSLSIEDSSVNDKMSFDVCKEDFSVLNNRLRVENLQSLMLFGYHQNSFLKTFGGLFRKAKALRVIFLSEKNYSMEDLLPNYLNLVHLRYLRISGVFESRLCKNISRYYHVRVLDLHKIYYRLDYDLPRDMSNLIKLHHFLVSDDNTMHLKISNVGRLKSLQALERFMVKRESQGFELKQIGHLFELHGSLHIENLGKVESREEADEAKLMHKKHLHKLILDWDINQSSKDPACEEQVLEGLKPNSNLSELYIIGHGGTMCPSWLGVNLSVKNLDSLSLNNVAWETFPPTGKLWLVNAELPSDIPNRNFHKLRMIELVKLDGVKKWVVDSTSQFYSCLEVLKIKDCGEFRELSFSNYACSQQEQNIWFPKLKKLVIDGCSKLCSLPPVPWTDAPCSIEIRKVGLGFQELYLYDYDTGLCLNIEGKVGQDTSELWKALDFDHLIEVKHLVVNCCPPLPLDRLKMLSSLKHMKISDFSNAFWLVEDGRGVQCQFPIESITITNVGTSGKELTQVLAYMPKLSELYMDSCDKITGLGVMEQQEKTTPSVTRVGALAGRLVPWSLDRQFLVTSNEAETHIEVQDISREEDEIAQAEDGLLLLPPQLQKLEIWRCPEVSLRLDDSAGGLQGLHSLRSLTIWACPKFLPPSSASFSSCCPFPSSLQELNLKEQSLTIQPTSDCTDGRTLSLSNLASLIELDIIECEGGEGFWRHLPWGCLTQLSVRNTSNFFLVDPPGLPSSQQELDRGLSSPFSVLQSLQTDDLGGDEEIEEALQLLTSLQELTLFGFKKLRFLPAGLRGLPNLKRLKIVYCTAIRSLPTGGLPDSLHTLTIWSCEAIRSLPKGCFPNSLQELEIVDCKAIRRLPKDRLPNSLRRLDVRDCGNKELKRHCRKLIGTIPIVQVD
ncbi:hypothetical protein EJB05_42498, partial [Eragrostis curvula]